MKPSEYLTNDHRRLEVLLADATKDAGIDMQAYNAFRSGLLRHIGIEEKIVLPLLRERNCEFLPERQLRLEHGAIAALLVPPPSPELLRVLRLLLERHNQLEEAGGTLYEILDDCSTEEHTHLVDRLRAFPAPPLSRHIDNPAAFDPARRAVARAGYDFDTLAAE